MKTEIDPEPSFLTRQQAIEQGYTCVGKFDLQWQNQTQIEELDDEDLKVNIWLLFDTETQHLGINPDLVKDSVMDLIWEAESDIGCDTDMGKDAVEDFDWSKLTEVIDAINEALKSATYRSLTKIRLIP